MMILENNNKIISFFLFNMNITHVINVKNIIIFKLNYLTEMFTKIV